MMSRAVPTRELEWWRAFGKRVRVLRMLARMTQEEVARGLLFDRKSVSRIEAGQQRMIVTDMLRLAAALRVKPVALLILRKV